MPSNILPQLTVYNEFLQFPAELTDAMRAMIVGPQAELTRYGTADEKDRALLGDYDPLAQHVYPYPNRKAGSVIDQSYTKLWADNALLMYLFKQTGVQGTVKRPSGYYNRVVATDLVFKSNGTAFPRSAIFGDRDCQLGDVVDLRPVGMPIPTTKRTTIAGFVADVVAPVVDAAEADDDNAATQSASATATKTAGHNNQIKATASAATYDGSADGDVDETYTIEVTQGSVGGDLTTARLKVVSASGHDDYYPANGDGSNGVTVSAVSTATVITPRGAKVTFSLDGSQSTDSGVTTNDLLLGQTWTVVVHQAWTETVATSGGAYTGTTDTTYIVTVQHGGPYLPPGPQAGPQAGLIGPQFVVPGPTVTVTTSTGVDAGGPYAVTGADVVIPIGSLGVTVSFDTTELNAGDRFTIEAHAQGTGAYHTLLLQDNLPNGVATTLDIETKLYIRKQGLLIPHDRTNSPPNLNWSQDGAHVTVKDGVTAFDSTYTFGGVQQPLPLAEGQLYAESRQWLQGLTNNVGSLQSVAEIRSVVGVIHPDNPLAWGLNLALANSSGSVVWYGGVGNPDDSSSWISFLDVIKNLTGFYHVAPLTYLPDVLAAFKAHVTDQSTPEVGAFRAGWFGLQSRSTKPVVNSATTSDHADALATVTADTDTGLLTLLQVSAGNAKFVTNGVQAADVVRFNYGQDGFGNVSYQQFVVDRVINEDSLSLLVPFDTDVTVPQKFEVWHPMSKNDITSDLLAQRAQYTSSRTRAVWPDLVDGNQGYFLCACLAGLSSGVTIHQGLKNLQLLGVTTLSSQSLLPTEANLLTLMTNGVWVVGVDPFGFVYSRSAVTTDPTTTLTSEEVINRNADAQAFYLLHRVEQFIGVSNVVDGTLKNVRSAIISGLTFVKNATTSAMRLGPPLLGYTIIELRPHTILKDRIVATVQLSLPYPFNKLDVTIQIVA